MRVRWLWALAVVVGCASAPATVAAQQTGGDGAVDVIRALRQAAALESAGRLQEAERVLRAVLRQEPGSTGVLFALERVLRSQGRPEAILAAADTFLAAAPGADGARTLKLRVLAELDSTAALEREAEAWLERNPYQEAPYREVARIYREALGPERALEVLEVGRARLADPGIFRLEEGDLRAERGDLEGAARAWAAAAREGGAALDAVRRRLDGMGRRRPDVARMLADAMVKAATPEARGGAAIVLLDAGLPRDALRHARQAAAALEGPARAAFLEELATRARARDVPEVAAWAFQELGDAAASVGERRRVERRTAELALSGGDTLVALEALERLAGLLTPGSVDQRRVRADLIRLRLPRAEADVAAELLRAFRQDFPDAQEADALAAAAAAELQKRGDLTGAAAVLIGAHGPRAAVERAYLMLAGGQTEAGRRQLLMAVSELPPREATGLIQLAALLGRVTPESAGAVARAAVTAHRGAGAEAARALVDAVDSLPEEDRPAVLAHAARTAEEGGAPLLAAGIRRRLLEAYPDAPETPAAALALARHLATTAGGRSEAVSLLEALLVRDPDGALAPDARLELERLRRQGGSAGGAPWR